MSLCYSMLIVKNITADKTVVYIFLTQIIKCKLRTFRNYILCVSKTKNGQKYGLENHLGFETPHFFIFGVSNPTLGKPHRIGAAQDKDGWSKL